MAWVSLRRHTAEVPLGLFDDFPPAQLRPGGATVLARIEDDDPVLPWTDASGACAGLARLNLAATLRPLAVRGVDCFDMQSLSSMILNQIALTVADAAKDNDARVIEHRLAIVPHIATPTGSGAPALPGFGFVYQADLVAKLDGGVLTGGLTLSIPLTVVWSRSVGEPRTLATAIDPLDGNVPLVDATFGNAARITVHAADDSISSAFARCSTTRRCRPTSA
jgi:hypothetical protein